MESSDSGCPTEILIDLEDDNVSSNVKDKSIHTSLHIQKAMINIENKENDSSGFEIKGKCQNIMDMSPPRGKNEYNEQTIDSFPNSEQDVYEDLHACPTAILVDIPSSSRMCPQKSSLLYCKRDSHQEETVIKSKSINQDVKVDEFDCLGNKKYKSMEDDSPCSFMTMKSESPTRVRMKTPSPKSMCRISKEASKIIHDLDSVLLDEDSPLIEEILPICINFDTLDLDGNSDEEISVPKTETPSDDKLSTNTKPSVNIQNSKIIHDLDSVLLDEDYSLIKEILPIFINYDTLDLDGNSDEEISVPKIETPSDDKLSTNAKPSVNIQTEQKIIHSEIGKAVTSSLSPGIQNFHNSSKLNLARSSSAPFKSKIKDKDLNTSSITSEELQSPESGSFDDSVFFVSTGETSSVFIENNLTSDDKENEQERKEVLLSKPVINARALQKSFLPEKRVEKSPSLRNISNIKSNVTSRYIPTTNKGTSLISSLSSVSSKSMEQKIDHKQVLKKTTSAESPKIPKLISRSDSSQYGYRRESVYQSNFTKQKPPLLSQNKSSSSDVKHSGIQMKTPSRRYSIATPLQSASAKKSTLTPSLSRIQSPRIPRFTPQSVRGNRLSFSKSWQQSNKSKGFKNQNSALTSATVVKPSFSGSYSSKLNKQEPALIEQVLNQSISVVPSSSRCSSLSTTSKNRFCSKLNLPSSSLNPEQNKKLARALFPSMPRN